MSYILDALKKAEAERKLGAVPDIHAPATHGAARERRAGRTLWLGGALATLAALLALAWLQPWRTPRGAGLPLMPDLAQRAPAAQPPVPPAAIEPVPKPVPAPVPDKPAVKPTKPVKPSQPEQAKAATTSAPKPMPAKPPAASGRTQQAAQKPEDVQTGERQAKEPEPLTLRELPEQIQREIPALAIGGYIYSNNPAERSLLINNKLLREGDEVAPGLTLEKMMRGSVLLHYKGYRYRMPY